MVLSLTEGGVERHYYRDHQELAPPCYRSQLFSGLRNELFPIHLVPDIHGALTLWLNSKALSMDPREHVEHSCPGTVQRPMNSACLRNSFQFGSNL